MTKTTKPLKVGTEIKSGRKWYTVRSSTRRHDGVTLYDTREGIVIPATEIKQVGR